MMITKTKKNNLHSASLTIILTICFIASFIPNLYAADKNSYFAIEGAGIASCEKYRKARTNKTTDFYLFAGWLDGFVTATNSSTKNTYDFTPWQSIETLTSMVNSYCKKKPKDSFYKAVSLLIATLHKDRLLEQSNIISVKYNGKGAILYQVILEKIQQLLLSKGYYKGKIDGKFGNGTAKALVSFQKDNNITATGLPDQNTMYVIFKNN